MLPARKSSILNPQNAVLVMLILLSLAMAGPSWQIVETALAEDEGTLVLVLDLSYSMNTRDVLPSRLDRAKQKICDIMAERQDAKTALIVYAGTAHLVLPLTDDRQILKSYRSALIPHVMPVPGSRPGEALTLTKKILGGIRSSTVVFITDGVSPDDISAFIAYRQQREEDQLVLLATATEQGGPIPLGEEGHFMTDSNGHAVTTALDMELLKTLADRADVHVTPITVDDTDVQKINRRIRYFLQDAQNSRQQWDDAGYWLLFPIMIVGLLWFRKGWSIQWWVLLPILIAPSSPADAGKFSLMDLWLTPDQQGQYYFEQGKYAEAAPHFESSLWRGTAFYLSGDFNSAASEFIRSDTAKGYFNLANSHAHMKNYLLAVQYYDQALRLRPEYTEARENKAWVEMIIRNLKERVKSELAEGNDPSMKIDKARQTEGEDLGKKSTLGGSSDDRIRNAIADGGEDLVGMTDEELKEMWLRRVQHHPGMYLRNKFEHQLRTRTESAQEQENPW